MLLIKTNKQKPIRIKSFVSISLLIFLVFSSCNDTRKEQSLSQDQIALIHQFVAELNQSLDNFEFDFIKEAWSHPLFKRRIGKLGNIGHDVFNHVYKTTIKSAILNFNLDLINQVKHSDSTLKHIKTNISASYAEVTYLLIDKGYYHFIKYMISIQEGTPYLSDIYSFKENRWFSNSMRELIVLNMKHRAMSSNRHEANRALDEYQFAIDNHDYEYAFEALNRVPESHRIFNNYKIARIKTASFLGDSLLLRTIERVNNPKNDNTIYIDYLMANYLNVPFHREDVKRRMKKEIGISKTLLDSLYAQGLIWE